MALNEDSYIMPLPETQRTSYKGRGQKDGKSQRLGRTVGKQCLLDMTHELTAAMVTCRRPTHDQDHQCVSVERGGAYEDPPLLVGLWIVTGGWGKRYLFCQWTADKLPMFQ